MSKIVKKRVDTVLVNLNDDLLRFETLLLCDLIKGVSLPCSNGKTLEVSHIEDYPNYVIGIVITTRQISIPPKRNLTKKTSQSLDIAKDEGLAYGNSFLYDKRCKFLMYEVNKNGSSITEFTHFIKHYCSDSTEFGKVIINLRMVLNIESYKRFLRMKQINSFEIEIAQPERMIAEDDSLENIAKSAKGSNSDKMLLKLSVNGNKKEGLFNGFVQKTINAFQKLSFEGNKGSVTKLILHGTEQNPDNEDESIPSIIDMITDKFITYIEFEEPALSVDVQPFQRKQALKLAYDRNIDDFELILSKYEL